MYRARTTLPPESITPLHVPLSTSRSWTSVSIRKFTPLSTRSCLKRPMTAGALSEPICRCLISINRAPTEAALRFSSSISGPSVKRAPWGAPNLRKTLSTLSTNSQASTWSPVRAARSPPMSGRRFRVPSEKVPQPPTPHIISQGVQCVQ